MYRLIRCAPSNLTVTIRPVSRTPVTSAIVLPVVRHVTRSRPSADTSVRLHVTTESSSKWNSKPRARYKYFLRCVLWRICTRLNFLLNIDKDKKALSFFLWSDLRLGNMEYGWFGHRSWETWMNLLLQALGH